MAINWQEVLTTIGSTAVIVSAFAFLTKSVINHLLTRDVEKFKARLKSDADMEVEKLKNSLQMVAVEHQVRFAKLHEKRAEVIAELYNNLVTVFWDCQHFVLTGGYPREGQQADYEKTLATIREFVLLVEVNRIYLSDNVCEKLDSITDAMNRAVIPVGVYGAISPKTPETYTESYEAVVKAYHAFEGDIPAARRTLEAEFRTILGG